MSGGEYTAAQLYGAISAALRAGDMEAVAWLLQRVAVVDPDGAQTILDTLNLLDGAR